MQFLLICLKYLIHIWHDAYTTLKVCLQNPTSLFYVLILVAFMIYLSQCKNKRKSDHFAKSTFLFGLWCSLCSLVETAKASSLLNTVMLFHKVKRHCFVFRNQITKIKMGESKKYKWKQPWNTVLPATKVTTVNKPTTILPCLLMLYMLKAVPPFVLKWPYAFLKFLVMTKWKRIARS